MNMNSVNAYSCSAKGWFNSKNKRTVFHIARNNNITFFYLIS